MSRNEKNRLGYTVFFNVFFYRGEPTWAKHRLTSCILLYRFFRKSQGAKKTAEAVFFAVLKRSGKCESEEVIEAAVELLRLAIIGDADVLAVEVAQRAHDVLEERVGEADFNALRGLRGIAPAHAVIAV